MKGLLFTSTIFLSISYCHAQPGHSYAHDAIEKKYEKDNADNKAKGMAWLQNASSGKTEPSYNFTQTVTMHITTYRDGEQTKDANDMQYFLANGQPYFGIKADESSRGRRGEMFIIYDNKNNSMVMLNEKEKSAMAMNINAFMSAEAQAKRNETPKGESSMKCNKTGKTKMIQGYKCFEFVCIDEDRNTRTEAWVTTELKADISKSFAKGPMSIFNTSQSNGFMMEGNFYKNNQLQTKMEVTTYDPKANVSKNMSDYKMSILMSNQR